MNGAAFPETRLHPDAAVVLVAAQELLRDEGLADVTIEGVSGRTGLDPAVVSRHFSSADELRNEVLAEAFLSEIERLCGLMEQTRTATEAVTAWVCGRLALAFDAEVESDLRYLAQQAQALYVSAPEAITELYQAMMQPLVEQLEAGTQAGEFDAGDPWVTARSIGSVVWACVVQEWEEPASQPEAVRDQTVEFCLRGLGISPAP